MAITTLLHIGASPRGAASESRQIAETFLDSFRAAHPDKVIET
jgi:FMN-dependent NADH-azoreductase